MKRRILILLSLSLAAISIASPLLETPPKVDRRIAEASIKVVPDRSSWTYELGAPATFAVSVLVDGHPLENVEISYKLGLEKLEGPETNKRLKNGTGRISAEGLLQPGFLRCSARAIVDGKEYKSLATVAYAPTQIAPTQKDPQDFDNYWTQQLHKLDEVPLKLDKRLVPELCGPGYNTYAVSFQSIALNKPVLFYGMLSEPSKPGKYPAVLRTPGAGVRPYRGARELAENGIIALQIGIHGIPVTYPEEIYERLKDNALRNYWSYNLEDRDSYYYNRVYLACVRANDILASHPNWDRENLVVSGGSQGGQLSIVTAALDMRVTAVVANYPAYCDVTGYLHGRAGGWPHLFSEQSHRTEAKLKTSQYYDTVNFAKRLTVPGSYAWGYNDLICPPTSMYATYNAISAPKELHLQLDMGHSPSEAFAKAFNERIFRLANAKQGK